MTELVFILDNSGSMYGLEKDTIGGFNSMIEKQKQDPDPAVVSLVTFNSHSNVVLNRVPLDKVPLLTDKDYRTGGCTALLDAVGDAVIHIRRVHKDMPKEARPAKTVFVITTDGMENASRRHTYDEVRRLIEKRQKNQGWEFLFLGANIDAAKEASRFGISADHAADYHCDAVGTAVNYESISAAVSEVRRTRSLSKGWRDKIDEDYQKRGN